MLAVGTIPGVGNGQLVGLHEYTVTGFVRDSAGIITGVQLRNPWGVDGGSWQDGSNDGIVTVSAADLFAFSSAVDWGRA